MRKDLKLDLSRKEKETQKEITLGDVESTFSELVGEGCDSAPKKEKKKKLSNKLPAFSC